MRKSPSKTYKVIYIYIYIYIYIIKIKTVFWNFNHTAILTFYIYIYIYIFIYLFTVDISHCDDNEKKFTTVLKASTSIITNITSGTIGLATILVILSVSTFISAIILYVYPKCNLTCSVILSQCNVTYSLAKVQLNV